MSCKTAVTQRSWLVAPSTLLIYSLREQYPRKDFCPFHGRKHLLFYFILIYCIFFCHLFSQKEITIFIHFRIIIITIICVSPKNSRRGGQVLLLAIVRYIYYMLCTSAASRARPIQLHRYYCYVFLCIHIIIVYTTIIYITSWFRV